MNTKKGNCSHPNSIIFIIPQRTERTLFRFFLSFFSTRRKEKLKRSRFLAGLFTMIAGLAIILFITLKHNFLQTTNLVPLEINIHTIGNALLSSDKYGYILPFEAISILLLACIIGGIMIARKR